MRPVERPGEDWNRHLYVVAIRTGLLRPVERPGEDWNIGYFGGEYPAAGISLRPVERPGEDWNRS